MNFRVTLVVLVVALGLAAFVYFYEFKGSEVRRAEREALEKLFPVQTDEITSIRIAHSGGKQISMVRRSGTWVLIHPVETECDPEMIRAFLDTLATARREENVGSGDLVRYGLDAPAAVMEIESDGAAGRRMRLQFGRINPLQTLVYVLEGDSQDVLLTTSSLLTMALNTDFGWRDKRMIQVDRDRIARMSFRTLRAGSLSVRRDAKHGWISEGSVPWRVDPVRAMNLLLTLSDLRAIGVGAESKEDVDKFGVGSRKFGAVLEFEDGSTAGDVVFGFATSKGATYAIVPQKPEIFQVDGQLTEQVTAFTHDPRDRRVFPPFESGKVQRIEVVAPADNFVIERRSTLQWSVLSSQKHDSTYALDPVRVAAMLDELISLEITSFPEMQPDEAFFKPVQISVRLYDDAGLVSGLELGRKDPKGLFTFARGVDEPAAFLLSPSLLMSLPLDLERLGQDEIEVPGGTDRG